MSAPYCVCSRFTGGNAVAVNAGVANALAPDSRLMTVYWQVFLHLLQANFITNHLPNYVKGFNIIHIQSVQTVQNNSIKSEVMRAMKDLDGYIRQSTAASRYGLTSAAITLRRRRSPGKIKTKVHDGVVFVFEDDVKNFVKAKPGPKANGRPTRKRSKVS